MNLEKLNQRKEALQLQLKNEQEALTRLENAIAQGRSNISAIYGAIQDVEYWKREIDAVISKPKKGTGCAIGSREFVEQVVTKIPIKAKGTGTVENPEVSEEELQQAIDGGTELNID